MKTNSMSSLLALILPLFMAVTVKAEDVKIEFITPSIVHIVKGQPTASLVVTAKPETVALKRKGHDVSSSKLTVRQDATTGRLTFLTAGGKVLLREKGCDVDKVSQTFALDRDEAIYGLGTLQNGKMNRRGEHKRMEQSNLEDFQNVVQSIKGWGLYWENYSPTLFDDSPEGMTLTSEAGQGIDYYFMYGGSADGVIALMRRADVSTVDLRLLAVEGALQDGGRDRGRGGPLPRAAGAARRHHTGLAVLGT